MKADEYADFFRGWPLWLPLVVVPIVCIILHVLINIAYKIFYPKEQRGGKRWIATVLKTLYNPLKLFIWFLGLSILCSLYAHVIFDFTVQIMLGNLLRVGIIISLAWGLYIFVREAEKIILQNRGADITTVETISKLSFLTVAVLSLLLILPVFGIEIAGLLAFGGFSGIIVGMAARDTIANLIGSFSIGMDKTFRIGDWIYTTDGKIEGIVENIGWRTTCIRTFDKRPMFIPNMMITSLVIVNASRMTNRRIFETVSLRYIDADRVNAIVSELNEYLEDHDDLDSEFFNFIGLDKFADSSLDLTLRGYTKTVKLVDYQMVKQKILLEVYRVVRKHGGDMAFPTRTLSFDETKVHVASDKLV